MIIFYAGSDGNTKYNNILRSHGIESRLESYIGLGNKPPSDFPRYLLDSGGYTIRQKGGELRVEEYAEYIREHRVKLAFNLDTNDVQETLEHQEFLDKNTPAYIIPIYHFSDFYERNGLLEKYVKKYDFIAIGGVAGNSLNINDERVFYNSVFRVTKDKVKVHGLGITKEAHLKRYPFYSVDSTSWLGFARYGNSKIASKEMSRYRAKERHYLENASYELTYWTNLQKFITKLWKKRGITWT